MPSIRLIAWIAAVSLLTQIAVKKYEASKA
jgi:hypothetical protein